MCSHLPGPDATRVHRHQATQVLDTQTEGGRAHRGGNKAPSTHSSIKKCSHAFFVIFLEFEAGLRPLFRAASLWGCAMSHHISSLGECPVYIDVFTCYLRGLSCLSLSLSLHLCRYPSCLSLPLTPHTRTSRSKVPTPA